VRRDVGSVDDSKDVAFLHDKQVIAADLDLGAGPLSEEDAVAGLDVEGDELAGFIATARTHSNDLTFLRLLLDGIGDDDAAFGLLLPLEALDYDAVVQGSKRYVVSFLFWAGGFAKRWIPQQRDKRLFSTHVSGAKLGNDLQLFEAWPPALARHDRSPKNQQGEHQDPGDERREPEPHIATAGRADRGESCRTSLRRVVNLRLECLPITIGNQLHALLGLKPVRFVVFVNVRRLLLPAIHPSGM
jgi:hypothetical protein